MITCSNVGHFGRWGNSLFQYAASKVAAEIVGTELRIPSDWAGRKIFSSSVHEGPIDVKLRDVPEHEWEGEDNVNLIGYFQSEKWVSLFSRSKLKQWLVPARNVAGPEVAVHKRRGDYVGNGYYATVSDASYDVAIVDHNIIGSVKHYHCEAKSDQYTDFLEIMNARTILRSNSTFSWWAATLSNAEVYSPVVGDKSGWQDVEFIKGNHPKLCYLFADLHIKD